VIETPEPTTGKKKSQLAAERARQDYSVYKGRGRYAVEAAAEGGGDTTINSRFEINAAQNGGLSHQYDDVVRTRKERQQLHGGDCECCRDYYEAVGPLPPRLAAPLWKSPSPGASQESPAPPRRQRAGSPNPSSKILKRRDREIQEHKQEVSRHRAKWAAPSTPPDYWNIGFPDTQQEQDINRRAKEMNEDKKKRIEEEAKRTDGQYKKRKSHDGR